MSSERADVVIVGADLACGGTAPDPRFTLAAHRGAAPQESAEPLAGAHPAGLPELASDLR